MRIEIFEKNLLYDRIGKLWELKLKYERFTGGWSAMCHWFVLEKGRAAAGVLFDPKTKKILLVKQFRPMGIFYPEDEAHLWMTEIVAGGSKPGEDPKASFLRECKEEAGLDISQAELIYSYYPSPGFYGEKLYLYYAEFDSSQSKLHSQGLLEENDGCDARID